MKRDRGSERDRKEDRLSDLPDCVLLHIMKFMNTRQAVQTCVLSKRWKDLWKRLTNLTLHSLLYKEFKNVSDFDRFVSRILSCRDGSISLHKVDFRRRGYIEQSRLNRVIRYAVSHHVQHLAIQVNLLLKLQFGPKFKSEFQLLPCIFSCRSLTSLKLSIQAYNGITKFPKSLELPALKSLHLVYFTFTTSDKGCAEPFSTCNMLDTLVIEDCTLQDDAKVLCISNAKLSCLTMRRLQFSADLSTPNLSSFTITGDRIQELSACNLPFLEEVYIDVISYTDFPQKGLVLIRWLKLLPDVKIMTLSSSTLKILNVLSTPGSVRTQTPCFVRLKSLKVKMKSFSIISDEEVSRAVEYLFQNSPPARVDIIDCLK